MAATFPPVVKMNAFSYILMKRAHRAEIQNTTSASSAKAKLH